MMTLRDALEHFGGKKSRLAAALGITKQAISNWPIDDPIPENRERQLMYEIIPRLKNEHNAA